MSGMRQRLLGLCLPPTAFWLLDNSLTLVGQSESYWRGAYRSVNEGSPTFHQLLSVHPLAFVAGSLVWMAIFTSLILILPDTLALIISVAVTIGHCVGAATWLLFRFHYGYQMCNALFAIAAIFLGLGIRLGWQAKPTADFRLPLRLARWRWAVACVLGALAIWLFIWPRSA